MEMRIVMPAAASATALVDQLRLTFGGERISLLGDSRVAVRVESESDRAVVRVLEVAERWLHHAGAGTAEMRLGKGSCTVARWAPGKPWQ